MTELLALNKKTKVELLIASIPRPASGVPVNALPGWEELPLYKKLPMLKCPTNQIIFSKNKIGQEINTLVGAAFRVYDPYMQLLPSGYNSLDDPHLRKYYEKKSRLKHLRDINKITERSEVLCNLREFNSYRSLLQEYHLGLVHREVQKREDEQRDRALVFHAESIAAQEYKKFAKQGKRFDLQDVLILREKSKKRREEKLASMLKRLKLAVDRIEKIKKIRTELLAQKSFLHDLMLKQHKIVAYDLEKKRIIALKKRYADRETRIRKFREFVFTQKVQNSKQKAIKRWEKLLELRMKKHKRNTKMLKEAEERAQRNIERRKRRLEKQWRTIQESIAKRAKQQSKSLTSRKKNKKPFNDKLVREYKDEFSKDGILMKSLVRSNISHVVNIALDIEEKVKKFEDYPDCTFKVAEYILDVVIKTFKADLSKSTETMDLLSLRIAALFKSLKTIQIVKVNSILKNSSKIKRSCNHIKEFTYSTCFQRFGRSVSFGSSTPIGLSFQKIKSDIEIKRARSRDPTPAGSLEAIAPAVYARHLEGKESCSERKSAFAYCSMEERIYIEHFYIKFRRALIVGVSRKVFDAVRCYWNNHILNPRKELLDLDRQYLVTNMAKSILSYTINSYNFDSNLKLCINALSADIIFDLQQGLLKPSNDIRYIRKPKCRCNYDCSGIRY